MWRQGDIFIQPVPKLPSGVETRPVSGTVLVHGEVTGHSHRIEDAATAQVFSGLQFGEFFLDVKADARIVHEEHGPIELKQGTYRVWRQREYSPERIRHVYD